MSFKRAIIALSTLGLAATMIHNSAQAEENLVSQLPGASTEGTVVISDSPHVRVEVEEFGTEDSAKVTVKNNYDHAFECFAPGVSTDPAAPEKLPNVLSEARIINDSLNYYRAQPFLPKDGKNVPVIGVIPTDIFLQYVPEGSSGRIFGAETAARAELSRQWDRARIAGHTGEIAPFTLDPSSTKEITVKLNTPGHGPRTDFDAGALLYCTDVEDQQAYVFAGFEPGVNPMWSGLSSADTFPGNSSSKRK